VERLGDLSNTDDIMDFVRSIHQFPEFEHSSVFTTILEAQSGSNQFVFNHRTISSVGELFINGDDLIELGLEGRVIGRLLNQLLEEVIVNGLENTHDDLIEFVLNQG